jgi:hypothetical protein
MEAKTLFALTLPGLGVCYFPFMGESGDQYP